MYVTTVRGRRYENILIRKFNGRKFFDTKFPELQYVNIVKYYTIESALAFFDVINTVLSKYAFIVIKTEFAA